MKGVANMKRTEGQFWDMELRVSNTARRREFRIEFMNPGSSWPYGPLYLYEEAGQRWALLGDLRIPVTAEESLRLIKIAELRLRGLLLQLDSEGSDLSRYEDRLRKMALPLEARFSIALTALREVWKLADIDMEDVARVIIRDAIEDISPGWIDEYKDSKKE